MLAAGGVASAGHAIRNWDNARGHHEMLDVVRLNEAVLAHSGGHYLSPPAVVTWTDEHAAARDHLLATPVDGHAPLLKDPRTLLVLPFWRASALPFQAIGIVRHPLAVARSLEYWREMPLAEGVALWTAHNHALLEDRAHYHTKVLDFDAPDFVAHTRALFPRADAAAYEPQLVHHDDREPPAIMGLEQALALHRQLVGKSSPASITFPRAELTDVARALGERDLPRALASARAALASVADAAAVFVPIISAFMRAHAYCEARLLIDEHAARLDAGVADLLHGKVLLAAGDAAGAILHLEAACAVPRPYYQARHLLPQALRAAGRAGEARVAMRAVTTLALYPHGPLSTLAEWSWLDGDRVSALAEMAEAIAMAPRHRRGRLRTRLAEWYLALDNPIAAREELERALDEDPSYTRSRQVLSETIGRLRKLSG
jgi:tetratricopeptide (TPR) repeat protein